ncbi:hypothetical protein ACWCQS_34890 [Streptomyces sp. NPDC002076]
MEPPLAPNGHPPRFSSRSATSRKLRRAAGEALDGVGDAVLGKQAGTDSPSRTEHYERWHALLRALLDRIPGLAGTDSADFTAHALLAATRADLVAHLAGENGLPREEMRARLAEFAGRTLCSHTPQEPADQG